MPTKKHHKIKIKLPPSIMEKAERAAKVSGKPVELFAKLYIIDVVNSELASSESKPTKK